MTTSTAAEASALGAVVAPTVDPWTFVEKLPCTLTVDVSLPSFGFGDLVGLRAGSIVNTRWTVGHDVPLRVNGQLLAWCEFEMKGGKLAVRLTELA